MTHQTGIGQFLYYVSWSIRKK